MSDQEITAQAQRFWELAGLIEPFPRSLETAVSWALPIAIIRLPRLTISELLNWLSFRGVRISCQGSNRDLRAGLVVSSGRGVIFLEGSDPDDERRFSLAHEIAHFILDYLLPRERVLAAFGCGGREILDGYRVPTTEERLRGILHGVKLGTYTHLMDRSPDGDADRLQVIEAEDRADRLALELLAPEAFVLGKISEMPSGSAEGPRMVTEILMQEYGLPKTVAGQYCGLLLARMQAVSSFREWLGF